MKIKEVTIGKSIKRPIEGVAFSNNEASCFITIELGKGEDLQDVTKKYWDIIKQEINTGLDPDPDWIAKRDEKKR